MTIKTQKEELHEEGREQQRRKVSFEHTAVRYGGSESSSCSVLEAYQLVIWVTTGVCVCVLTAVGRGQRGWEPSKHEKGGNTGKKIKMEKEKEGPRMAGMS